LTAVAVTLRLVLARRVLSNLRLLKGGSLTLFFAQRMLLEVCYAGVSGRLRKTYIVLLQGDRFLGAPPWVQVGRHELLTGFLTVVDVIGIVVITL
jgi:hypothetical protein